MDNDISWKTVALVILACLLLHVASRQLLGKLRERDKTQQDIEEAVKKIKEAVKEREEWWQNRLESELRSVRKAHADELYALESEKTELMRANNKLRSRVYFDTNSKGEVILWASPSESWRMNPGDEYRVRHDRKGHLEFLSGGRIFDQRCLLRNGCR